MSNLATSGPSFVFSYWKPWKEDSNIIDSYLDYSKDVSLSKYTADTVGAYINQASKQQILAIDNLGDIIGLGLNALSNQLTSDIVLCSDQDFQIASWMAEESYQCSIELFKDLPGEKNDGDERLEEMFDMLPRHFKPKELAPLYKSLNVSKRTAERMLEKLKKAGRLTSVKKGEYEKVLVADVSNGG